MSEDFWENWLRRRRLPFGFPMGFGRDLEDVMKDFDRMINQMLADMEKEIPKDLVRERRLADGTLKKEYGPLVYGYSVTVGPDGRPVIREFGNIKPSLRGRRPMEIAEKREPLMDVIDEEEEIKVVAEIPGVEKEEIKLDAAEKSLTISVDTPGRKYHKVAELPAEILPETAKASLKNGILEVRLKKAVPAKPRGRSVPVE